MPTGRDDDQGVGAVENHSFSSGKASPPRPVTHPCATPYRCISIVGSSLMSSCWCVGVAGCWPCAASGCGLGCAAAGEIRRPLTKGARARAPSAWRSDVIPAPRPDRGATDKPHLRGTPGGSGEGWGGRQCKRHVTQKGIMNQHGRH